MGNIYCPSCGYKNAYSLSRPNFCSSCGEPFNANAKIKTNKMPTNEDLDEDGTDVFEIPDIRNLDVSVSYEGMGVKHKGSDFINEPPKEESQKNIKQSGEKRKVRRRRK